VARGADLQALLALTLEEAAFGTEKEIQVDSLAACDRCEGSGCEPGTHPTRCGRCGGSGEVQDVQRSIFGTGLTQRTCGQCQGSGEQVADP